MSTGFTTARHKQFRTAVVLAFVALLSSLPTAPLATARRAADASPLTVASIPNDDAAVTSKPLTAMITGAIVEPNAQVLSNQVFSLNFAFETIQDGLTGVNASWKSNVAFSLTVNIWFVASDSKDHIVFVSFARLPFGAQKSNAVFQTFSSALPSGIYTVYNFVVTPSGTALSISAIVIVLL